MSNLREFVQLAKTWNCEQSLAGWFMSVKMDGLRVIWDGGITRGMSTTEVPWANTTRDSRYVCVPWATGLWTRYGKPIQAPAWFLDQLPDFPIDGELWMGPKKFQPLVSCVKTMEPGPAWKEVKLRIFDSPSYREWLADGEIRLKKRYEKLFKGFVQWATERAKTRDHEILVGGRNFEETIRMLDRRIKTTDSLGIHVQRRMPFHPGNAKNLAIQELDRIVDEGHEGLMFRAPNSFWVPKRANWMLKYKPFHDAEGVVVGYVWGEETDLGSKHLGKMGSLIIMWEGRRFKIAGFEDEERTILNHEGKPALEIGYMNPGKEAAGNVYNPRFPRGTKVTFQYRELTDAGIPKEARYLRKYDE